MFDKIRKNKNKVPKKIRDASRIRLERCEPFVADILQTFMDKETAMGDASPSDIEKSYNEVAVTIISTMLAKDMHYDDAQFSFKLLKQVVDLSEEYVLSNIEKSFNKATDKLWGGKDLYDIKLSDIDKVLKE